ncbi:MAG: HD domain-containing protein [Oscillospiraceae bacterium]
MNYNEIEELVKSKLSLKRYNHTQAVLKLASELAAKNGENIENAKLAAILHDITKEDSDEIQLQILKKSDIIFDDVTLKNNNLYHSVTAYLYAKNTLNIENTDVLNAIYYHTTARENYLCFRFLRL